MLKTGWQGYKWSNKVNMLTGWQANMLKSMVGLTKNKGHLCNITVNLYIYNDYSLSQYHNVILH